MNLDYDDLRNAFAESKELVDLINDKVCYYFMNLKPSNLRVNDYVRYCDEAENIEFTPYHFRKSKIASKRIAGSLLVGDNASLIVYNADCITGRQNFTKLHEICHYFRNKTGKSSAENYSDLINNRDYNDNDIYEETVVNFAAAQLQIPTDALILMVLKGYQATYDFSKEFSSSYSANLKRLQDFLKYELDFTSSSAYSIVEEYKRNPESSYIRKMALDNEDEINEKVKNEGIQLNNFGNYNFGFGFDFAF
ncbi:ImmA/IrrE family metallo-endopeptidase [Fructilactobacillus vespulae]|uniref:ImmA/IrrE family metallo-endopeptidase n=1 Tax=Fructilactobacillus vespulae TaxID=1249630 RepID=UPI0039B4F5D7